MFDFVLDSSAIVAILLKQPGFERLLEAIIAAEKVAVGAPTLVEATIVLVARAGEGMRMHLHDFLGAARITVLPFSADHVAVAAHAYLRFGKGRHGAALNYGDCLAYASAALAGTPLLFIGNDFLQTDVAAAIR